MGVVDSAKERDKAVEIAKGVEGVKSVRKEFRIMADQPETGMNASSKGRAYDTPGDEQGCSPSPRVG